MSSMLKTSNSFQTVEKVQRELGFLSYMWYNVNGDENVGRKEKF